VGPNHASKCKSTDWMPLAGRPKGGVQFRAGRRLQANRVGAEGASLAKAVDEAGVKKCPPAARWCQRAETLEGGMRSELLSRPRAKTALFAECGGTEAEPNRFWSAGHGIFSSPASSVEATRELSRLVMSSRSTLFQEVFPNAGVSFIYVGDDGECRRRAAPSLGKTAHWLGGVSVHRRERARELNDPISGSSFPPGASDFKRVRFRVFQRTVRSPESIRRG